MTSRTISNVSRRSDLTISKLNSFSGNKYNFCPRSNTILIPILSNIGGVISCKNREDKSTHTRRAIFKWRKVLPTLKLISVAENNPLNRKMCSCSLLPCSRPLLSSNSHKSPIGISNLQISYCFQKNPCTSRYVMLELEQLLDFVTTPRR